MTDKEIFNKVIKKAEKNGYKNEDFHYPMCKEQSDNILKYYWASPIIFSHDFAKAFWGFEEIDDSEGEFGTITAWKYHLQQMVLEKEPLKYLERFLKD